MSQTTTNNNVARVAGQKFIIGDQIIWKGHRATVVAVNTNTPWKNYTIECDNGQHALEFSDQSFCEKINVWFYGWNAGTVGWFTFKPTTPYGNAEIRECVKGGFAVIDRGTYIGTRATLDEAKRFHADYVVRSTAMEKALDC